MATLLVGVVGLALLPVALQIAAIAAAALLLLWLAVLPFWLLAILWSAARPAPHRRHDAPTARAGGGRGASTPRTAEVESA